eukprot:1970108-Alexandrium_andersonii.AAC.1
MRPPAPMQPRKREVSLKKALQRFRVGGPFPKAASKSEALSVIATVRGSWTKATVYLRAVSPSPLCMRRVR